MKDVLKSALLEIGTEEVPASYCTLALGFMKSFAEEYLRSRRLPYKEVLSLGTPRRLSLIVNGFPAKSEEKEEEFWGPPMTKAKNGEGEWTPAALGFAKSQGVSVEQLSVRVKKEMDYLCFIKKQSGEPCEKILKNLFNLIIESIPFPKKMVWDESRVRFARPIRNLVALVDKQILRMNVGKVRSSNKTFGLSQLVNKTILIPLPQNYVSTLKNHCILVDPAVRKATILKASAQLAEKVGGKLKGDEALLEEVAFLVEHPVATLCHFDPNFLKLPGEVLTTCMRKQQKFFSILDEKGQLTSNFIAIRNGLSENQEIVRKGYEKVLTARLTDAQFFLNEDLKKPLEFYIKKCAGIIVQEKLGSIADKIVRMIRLSQICLELMDSSCNKDLLEMSYVSQAIRVSKFDLATQMVYELPELQGIVGAYYIEHYGYDKNIARSIREHYYPLTVQGELPFGNLSSLMAVVDKLDQLVGNFSIGNIPTGNKDPYGLRRHSTGILRILLHMKWKLSLRTSVLNSLKLFPISLNENSECAVQILDFLKERFQLLLQDQGFALDEIYAVTKNVQQKDVTELNVVLLQEKVAALNSVRTHPDFEAVTGAFKRISNILKQAASRNIPFGNESFSAHLLKEREELELYEALHKTEAASLDLLKGLKYKEALLQWVSIRKNLDTFFDKVMVMVDDKSLCSNRLSLLYQLESLFKQVADFSHLQVK